MSDEKKMTPEDAVKLVKEMLSVPALRKKVYEGLGIQASMDKTKGAYYDALNGKGLIPFIDRMIEDKDKDYLLPIDFYGAGAKINTLRNRVFQATNYIIDHLDTEDRKYYQWRKNIDICTRENGVLLKWKKNVDRFSVNGSLWFAEPVVVEESSNEWKNTLYDWIEDVENEWIHLKELNLTGEDVKTVRDIFSTANENAGREMFIVSVNTNEIRVKRV